MKKFLLLVVTMLSLGFSLHAEDEKVETCLVYGLHGWDTMIEKIEFVQIDPKLPSSILTKTKSARPIIGPSYYYGEAVCGGNYRMIRMMAEGSYFSGFNFPGLCGGSGYDFKAPKKHCVYYLGYKNWEGKMVDMDYYNDLEGIKIGKVNDQKILEHTLKGRVAALKKLIFDYKATEWEEPLTAELEKVKEMYKKATGEDSDEK
ncbi:hypothetical protein [Treponema sp.]|uniref:hypothetical protein n=1 Tax=Treponema sp. TaxID=166 RepID=UPI00388F9AAC